MNSTYFSSMSNLDFLSPCWFYFGDISKTTTTFANHFGKIMTAVSKTKSYKDLSKTVQEQKRSYHRSRRIGSSELYQPQFSQIHLSRTSNSFAYLAQKHHQFSIPSPSAVLFNIFLLLSFQLVSNKNKNKSNYDRF